MSAVDYTLMGLIGVAVAIVLCSACMWLIERRPDPGTRAADPRPEKPLRPADAETLKFVKAAGNDVLADYARDTDWLKLPTPDDDYRDPGINGPRFRPWQLVGALHDRQDVPRPGQDAGRGSSRPITGPGRLLRAIANVRPAGRSDGSGETSVSPPGRARAELPGPVPGKDVDTRSVTGPAELAAQQPSAESGEPGAQAAASRPFRRLPAAALAVLRHDRPARFWSAESMTECAQTAALLALAESILAGGV